MFKIKRLIISSFILINFFCLYLQAQVGINTTHPQGVFHIDSRHNTSSVSPTDAEMSDDIIINSNGQVGIGTVKPSSVVKVDLVGSFKMKDGNVSPLKNSRLVTDNDGLASWKIIRNNVRLAENLGAGINLQIVSAINGVRFPTGGYITIPPGKSLIQGVFYNMIAGFSSTTDHRSFVQLRYQWSENPTTIQNPTQFEYLTPSGGGYITIMGAYPSPEMVGSGYWVINNKSAGQLKLYLYVQLSFIYMANTQLVGVGRGDWPDSSLIVMPLGN